MSTTIVAEYFTDPLSGRCWSAEPIVRHLKFAFEDVEWVPRMTVLLADSGDDSAERARRSLAAARESPMPTVDGPWGEHPPSSWTACAAVAAVRERSPDAMERFLRRVRERVFVGGELPTSTTTLVELASEVRGVDAATLGRDLQDGTAEEALMADLERTREVASIHGDVRTRGTIETRPFPARIREGDVNAVGGNSRNDIEEIGSGTGASDGKATEESEEVVFVPPVVLFTAGEDRILAEASGRYDRLKDAVTTLDPNARSSLADPTPYGDKELKRRGMLEEVAEQFVDRDYAPVIERYLSQFERAFLPEVIEGVDATQTTCRLTLRELRLDGRVKREKVGEWSAWLASDGDSGSGGSDSLEDRV